MTVIIKIFNKTKLFFWLSVFLIILYLVAAYRLYFALNQNESFFIWFYGVTAGLFLLSRFIIAMYYNDHHPKVQNKKLPSVSFVVACKNEEASIGATIDAALSSDYGAPMELIAIDDGSTDQTLAAMKTAQRKWGKKLKIISFEENRGKREGMAEGVLAAKHEIIIFVDSDSFVASDATRLIVDHFLADARVGAVSGNSLVHNAHKNILTRMQSARYGTSFDVFKAAESVFGAVTCCPGCFSAYRREAILKVLDKWRRQTFLGTRSTFGDDRSLTNFILRDWKVVYCRAAKATTIVPQTYRQFFKQQLRWKKSWIREGVNSASFMWKRNPIASLSFYANLLIPVISPFMAFRALFWRGFFVGSVPVLYLVGLLSMSLLFGLFYYFISTNRYWWYVLGFSLMYAFVMIWQMPYALIRLRDTRWGTR